MTTHQLIWDYRASPGTEAPGSSTDTEVFREVISIVTKERCYLNPNLRMEQICRQVKIRPSALLKALKKHGYRNFCHFINQFRVEEAKILMASEDHQIYTLEAISRMAGFGTRQAFYNTFERFCGMKPARYRNMLKSRLKAV